MEVSGTGTHRLRATTMLGQTGTAFRKEVKTGGTNRRTAGSHARRSTGTGLAIRFSTGYGTPSRDGILSKTVSRAGEKVQGGISYR